MSAENPTTGATNPKLFVSYSWSSPQHEQWVLGIATQLRECSVDVILDKWDLKEGQDANAFMERMVTDPQIKKVILVCDFKYAEKADGRSGGVGTEAQIMSPAIYQHQDQSKFVAVVAEKDDNGKPYLPAYYKSRIYIDLSDNEHFAENFEQLLRWIFDKPLYLKPELGSKPSFLDGSTTISLSTNSRFSRAIDAIRNGRPYAKGALQEYLDTFSANLERFRITRTDREFDDLVIESIDTFKPYRNEALELFSAIAQYNSSRDAFTQLHHFFESLIPYLTRPEGVQSYREWDYDNFKFIVHELLIYCIAALLRYEAFDGVAHLLRTRYCVQRNPDYGTNSMQSFQIFRSYLKSLEYRNQRLKLSRLSVHADLLKQRAVATGMTFEHVMQADFVMYVRDSLDALRQGTYQAWWPDSLLYAADTGRVFEIFARAESTHYFEGLKPIFDIQKKEDFDVLLAGFKEGKLRAPSWDYRSIAPSSLMGYERLATRP